MGLLKIMSDGTAEGTLVSDSDNRPILGKISEISVEANSDDPLATVFFTIEDPQNLSVEAAFSPSSGPDGHASGETKLCHRGSVIGGIQKMAWQAHGDSSSLSVKAICSTFQMRS
jgi:hypothetical protein